MGFLSEKITPHEEKSILRLAIVLSLALLLLVSLDGGKKSSVEKCCEKCKVEIKLAPRGHSRYNKFCTRWYKRNEPFYIKGQFDKMNKQIGWRERVSTTKEIFYLCEKKTSSLLRGTHPTKKLYSSRKRFLAFIKKIPDCY